MGFDPPITTQLQGLANAAAAFTACAATCTGACEAFLLHSPGVGTYVCERYTGISGMLAEQSCQPAQGQLHPLPTPCLRPHTMVN